MRVRNFFVTPTFYSVSLFDKGKYGASQDCTRKEMNMDTTIKLDGDVELSLRKGCNSIVNKLLFTILRLSSNLLGKKIEAVWEDYALATILKTRRMCATGIARINYLKTIGEEVAARKSRVSGLRAKVAELEEENVKYTVRNDFAAAATTSFNTRWGSEERTVRRLEKAVEQYAKRAVA